MPAIFRRNDCFAGESASGNRHRHRRTAEAEGKIDGSSEAEERHAFMLQGLEPSARYRLKFHDSGAAETATGRDLMGAGLKLTLGQPNSSELVFIELAN